MKGLTKKKAPAVKLAGDFPYTVHLDHADPREDPAPFKTLKQATSWVNGKLVELRTRAELYSKEDVDGIAELMGEVNKLTAEMTFPIHLSCVVDSYTSTKFGVTFSDRSQ